MNGYLDLLNSAGWEYKTTRSPFVGQEKEKYGYFVHAATGRIVAAPAGDVNDKERLAWSFVCDLTAE